MKKTIYTMIFVCIIIVMFTGCSTIAEYHRIEIVNPTGSTIDGIYIRNADSNNWGNLIPKNGIQHVDMRQFSRNVDVMAIDTNGIVYSKYNVNLDEHAFTKVQSEVYMSPKNVLLGFMVFMVIGLISEATE